MSRRKGTKKKRKPTEILGLVAIGAFVILLVWLMWPGQTTTPPASTTTPTSNLAADFELTDIDGRVFRLSDYRGKVVVLEFMRTTCGACITEEPELRELRSNFSEDVVMVIISVDPAGDTNQVLREHRNQNLLGWIAMRDTSRVTSTYGVRATPTLFIINKNGSIAYQHEGVTESSVLIGEVSSLTR